MSKARLFSGWTLNSSIKETLFQGWVKQLSIPVLPSSKGKNLTPIELTSTLTPSDAYLKDIDFLKSVDNSLIKEVQVRISLLDFEENYIKDIQGQITTGSVNIDGSSSLRRTATLTFIPRLGESNLTDIHNVISINKKIKLEIGYTNNFHKYPETPILWFPLGIYIINDATFSTSTSDTSIALQLQDKMCLLNGNCGGVIPAAVTLDEIDDASGNKIDQATMYEVIQNVVSNFGGEDRSKIIIKDIGTRARDLLAWKGETPLYIYRDDSTASGYNINTSIPGVGSSIVKIIPAGGYIGYEFTDFVFPGALVADAGQTVCDILDKIRDALGNYEYFYDLSGNFRFQEIKNYYNTSYSTDLINQLDDVHYITSQILKNEVVYNFDNRNLITSFSNAPKFANIKNDFCVWGKRTDGTLLRYHLVLDEKPVPSDIKMIKDKGYLEDWRNVLYREGVTAADLGTDPGSYAKELLLGNWETLYDINNYQWKSSVLSDPSSVNYYFDFVDSDVLGDLNVSQIGRRGKIIKDDNVNCVFAPEIPDFILIRNDEYLETNQKEAILKGYDYITIPDLLENVITEGAVFKDAYSVVRELLYQCVNYNKAIVIQALPIYYLEPNTLIKVFDEQSGINGNFVINTISLPLSIADTMSINASAALERI